MKLTSLYLKNYRCFDELEMSLHPQLTVIVAENGQGKTTLLDAIRVGLWPFINSFELAKTSTFNDPANSIAVDDARLIRLASNDMGRQLPVHVKLTGDYKWATEGRNLDELLPESWERTRLKEEEGTKTTDDKQAGLMKDWAHDIQNKIRAPDKPPLDLPVFGYYGSGRLWAQKRLMKAHKDSSDSNDFYIRTFAYQNCLDPASSYKSFKEWFIWAWTNRINIDYLQYPKPEEKRIAQNRVTVTQRVIDALLKETTGWHTLEYSMDEQKSLVLNHDQLGRMKVDFLSDGIRGVLAMAGDIAYRCIKLNPQMDDAASYTKGVVLIDEVDMHLHPRWQQTILTSLCNAFPKIQFIVTTHSPQVLTTVKRENIRLLTRDAEGIPYAELPYQEIKGIESGVALNDAMHVNPIPPVEEAQWLADYTAKIESGAHEDVEGLALREKLSAFYGVRHPIMLDADRLIRFQTFKLRKNSTHRD